MTKMSINCSEETINDDVQKILDFGAVNDHDSINEFVGNNNFKDDYEDNACGVLRH